MNVTRKTAFYFLFLLCAIAMDFVATGYSCRCGRGFASRSSRGRSRGYRRGGGRHRTSSDAEDAIVVPIGFAYLFYFIFNWLRGLVRWLLPGHFHCSRPFDDHVFSWVSIFIFLLCISLIVWFVMHNYLSLGIGLLASIGMIYMHSRYRD